MKKIFIVLITFTFIYQVRSQISSLVSLDMNGKLVYTPDEKGNIIPDFSMVGYHQGEKELPNLDIKITLSENIDSSIDRYEDIQNAIDSLSQFPVDENGHRGAILLKSGYYPISQTLKINSSGIVLPGEGKNENGTILELTASEQINFIEISGSSNVVRLGSSEVAVTDDFIPIGTKSINIESAEDYQIGDRIVYNHTTTDAWIELIEMDNLLEICGEGHSDWSASTLRYKRRITDINGNQITLDAPIVEPIEDGYQTASIMKYTWHEKIEECGIENMRLLSSFTSDEDEDHGWIAIDFKNIENAWAGDVDAYYFGFGCVSTRGGAYQVTISDCGMFDYKSRISGGRRYGFNSDDCDLILFKNCISDQGRHDFVQGSRTPGPNVYTNCVATNSYSDTGPHHRWSTGTLWDNVTTDNDINVQNRLCYGSGHGWAGTQQVLWNCTANKIVIQNPPLSPNNWAIGCTSNEITNDSRFGVEEEIGFVESINIPINQIPSLYEAQLAEKLNDIKLNVDKPKQLDIYPNPTNGIVNLKSINNLNNQIELYDFLGNKLLSLKRQGVVDLSNFDSGIYFIKMGNEINKIIKN